MSTQNVKYVFVILTYRNVKDLEECVLSIKSKVKDFGIIIVNSFFDETTNRQISVIADEYGCDFLSIPNRGYSFGNNEGIRLAEEKYNYSYLIISNPDISISLFDDANMKGDIIAPKIVVASGKMQNPMHIKYNRLSDFLVYYGFKKGRRFFVFFGLGINKVVRLFSKIKGDMTIYAAHGSFVILSKDAIHKLNCKPFDDEMFLFAEEMVLAAKAKEKKLTTIYYPQIVIYHKEDGSMGFGDVSINSEMARGNIFYYEHYVLGKKQ